MRGFAKKSNIELIQAYLGILQNQYDFGEVIEIKFPNKDRDIEQAAIVFKSGVEVSLLPTQVAARESAKNIEAYVNQQPPPKVVGM